MDFKCNSYGSIFCDFLIDVNCCILNGRNTVQNDFIFVSTRGSSVVDYCIVAYALLNTFSNFSVSRVDSLIEETDIVGMVDLTRSIPDHSLLSWTMTLNFSVKEFVNQYHYSSDESCFKSMM